MTFKFEKYKGIHPGIVLARALEQRSIKQRPFALSIGLHPQTFNAILKGKRNLHALLALKMERSLDIEKGTLLIQQAFYDIKIAQQKLELASPNLSKFRKSLFWDTDVRKIDWEQQYKAIISGVFERGNEEEQNELARFYGKARLHAAFNMAAGKNLNLIPDFALGRFGQT